MREFHSAVLPSSGTHPEVAIGIPKVVVTARLPYKRREAERIGYRGPLTLADAVEQGELTAERAEWLVDNWKQAPSKQYSEMRSPRITNEPQDMA